jgi:SOS-response transcriptional repressor LexA
MSADVIPLSTARQRELLRFLLCYHGEHGYSPTIREMCRALGVTSTNAVACLLGALSRKGLVVQAGRATGGLFGSSSGRCTMLTPDGEWEARHG